MSGPVERPPIFTRHVAAVLPARPSANRHEHSVVASAVRGASEQTLNLPAGVYLASLRWSGTPDPDALSAGDFLSRL